MNSDRYAPRVAGIAYLLLIVLGMVSIALTSGVRTSHGITDTLRSISEHSGAVRFTIVLAAASGLTTLVLAAMLYAIVIRADRNLAILALSCRVLEGGFHGLNILATLVLLSLAQRGAEPATGELVDLTTTLKPLSNNIGAIFFALGSTVFCYLLVKARAIPVVLSTTGVIASILVLVGVPIQTAMSRNTFDGASALIWAPIALFEISAALWLIVKGARMAPAHRTGLEPVPA